MPKREEGFSHFAWLCVFSVLQIQFVDRVLIYQRDSKSEEFKYHLRDKINHNFECSLLVMCTENLILCQEKKLQCYSFNGVRQKEWLLDSHIRYIRSVGGMRGKEVLVAGLKNGQVASNTCKRTYSLHNVLCTLHAHSCVTTTQKSH